MPQSEVNLEVALDRFHDARVLVVGDLMLDRYISGAAERISPEAPVPVLLVDEETHRPGGAANVAMNLASLGVNVELVGRIGADSAGMALSETLEEHGVEISACCRKQGIQTIVKTRIVAKTQQICRIDHENPPAQYLLDLDAETSANLKRAIDTADAVILSDYAKGVVTQRLYDELWRICDAQNKLLAVDPKPNRQISFQRPGLMTPNRREAMELAGLVPQPGEQFQEEETIRRIYEKHSAKDLVITLGAEGLLVVTEGHVAARLPTIAREVFDVSGAGDTVVATIVAGMVSGCDLVSAAHLANLAAGIVVGKFGTAVPTQSELLNAIRSNPFRAQHI